MIAPTSFQSGKPEAPVLHRSAGLPGEGHDARAFDALESLIGLVLIMLLVLLWLGRDDS